MGVNPLVPLERHHRHSYVIEKDGKNLRIVLERNSEDLNARKINTVVGVQRDISRNE